MQPKTTRLLGGGSAFSWPALCRAGYRDVGSWYFRSPDLGVRLARTVVL